MLRLLMTVPRSKLVRLFLALLNSDPALPTCSTVQTRPEIVMRQAAMRQKSQREQWKDRRKDETLFRVTRFRDDETMTREQAIKAGSLNLDAHPDGLMSEALVRKLIRAANKHASQRGYAERRHAGQHGEEIETQRLEGLSRRGRRRGVVSSRK